MLGLGLVLELGLVLGLGLGLGFGLVLGLMISVKFASWKSADLTANAAVVDVPHVLEK